MSYKIPRIHQRYSPLDVVRYALSVGLGQDPCDLWQLEFVDDQKGPRVLPSFCAVLGHPGFWLADPATTVDARRLVHAEQGIRLLAPLPPEGEIVSETRIVDVVDKGPDKGALLYLEKDLRDAKTHTLVATETRTVMLRGDGGYSGPSGRIRPTLSQPEGPADADTGAGADADGSVSCVLALAFGCTALRANCNGIRPFVQFCGLPSMVKESSTRCIRASSFPSKERAYIFWAMRSFKSE